MEDLEGLIFFSKEDLFCVSVEISFPSTFRVLFLCKVKRPHFLFWRSIRLHSLSIQHPPNEPRPHPLYGCGPLLVCVLLRISLILGFSVSLAAIMAPADPEPIIAKSYVWSPNWDVSNQYSFNTVQHNPYWCLFVLLAPKYQRINLTSLISEAF